MWRTKLILAVAVLVCIVIYLSRKTRLTASEKKLIFWISIAAFPVASLLSALVFFGLHDDLYETALQASGIRDNDTALGLLSSFVGVAASLAVLAFADREQKARTEAHFAQLQRNEQLRIEQQKAAEVAAAQLRLDTQLKIDQTRQQTLLTAISVGQRQAADHEAEQILFAEFASYCERANIYQNKTKEQLRDEFRLELARRNIRKLNIRELEQSTNPEVQNLLRRPQMKLVPDDERE